MIQIEVKVKFENQDYILKYNENSGYFECNLPSGEIGGVKTVNVEAKGIYDDTIYESKKIQILKKLEEKVELNEQVAYFFDRQTFKLKEISNYENYNINIDEETNSKTTFDILKELDISNKDFVLLKKNGKTDFLGIIDDIVNESGEKKNSITCKYISNIFDRKIILKNESLISEKGIEDFILYTIQQNFTNSNDTLLNINFLDVEILTHTKVNKSIDNVENNIYNFHTFVTNCTQNYNIILEFSINNKRLKLKIYKESAKTKNVDATLADITNYTELFEKNVTAKVIVLCKDKSEHNWFLKSDRSVTDNINDENRAFGDIEVVYTEKVEDAYQTALNEFKSNTYKHMITFDLYKNSKIINVNDLRIGTPINVKTRNNIILNTYISAINDTGGNFITFTTGNMRINFIDKLKKELR
jgi:hypothetical protein